MEKQIMKNLIEENANDITQRDEIVEERRKDLETIIKELKRYLERSFRKFLITANGLVKEWKEKWKKWRIKTMLEKKTELYSRIIAAISIAYLCPAPLLIYHQNFKTKTCN